MPIQEYLASLPAARREGPANRVQTEPAVTVTNGDIEELFGNSVDRAGIIVRNTSENLTALIFTDAAGADIADATKLLPLESITLDNVKNAMYCAVEGGAGTITLTKLPTTT